MVFLWRWGGRLPFRNEEHNDTGMFIPILLFLTLILAFFLFQLIRSDLNTYRLPDMYTLPLLGLGIGVNTILQSAVPVAALVGAAVGFLVFWAIGALFYRLYHREGLGLGDAKLFAAAGAWLGLAMLPVVLLVAAGSALVYALLTGKTQHSRIAFGPWLAFGFAFGWGLRLIQTFDF